MKIGMNRVDPRSRADVVSLGQPTAALPAVATVLVAPATHRIEPTGA
jgi:hypothetical protein